jgi:hypothetical protein
MSLAGYADCVVKVTTLTDFGDLFNWRDRIASIECADRRGDND